MSTWIPPEACAAARSVGLLEYFQKKRPHELIRKGCDFCTKDHDSLTMSKNGKWNWFSRGIGGFNAIDFLMKAEGMSFTAAATEVLSGLPPSEWARTEPVPRKDRILSLPPKDEDSSVITAYLEDKRGIPADIISHFLAAGSIYQEARYKSVCFVAFDKNRTPRLVNVRGTSSNFKQTAPGSDRRFGFSSLAPGKRALHLFEGPIDLLSYAAIINECGYNFRNFNLLSLSGIYSPRKNIEESKLPVCLEQYLADYPDTEIIYVHFDNDAPGYYAGKALEAVIEGVKIQMEYPPRGYHDVNDYIIKRDKRSVKQ